MIEYRVNDRIDRDELDYFFVNWKSPPSSDIKRRLIEGSDCVIAARDSGKLVGFLTAISDGVMHAYISLLEVLESHQGQGIGTNLMKLALEHYTGYYAIVLLTDPDKKEFYERLGFSEIFGMNIMDFSYSKTKAN
jgi:ribosomal protein S18 acetylase RimI-like enzyme